MGKLRRFIIFSIYIFILFFTCASYAAQKQPTIQYNNAILTITNTSATPIDLTKSKLEFFAEGNIYHIYPLSENIGNIHLKKINENIQPQSQGTHYVIDFRETLLKDLLPNKKIKLLIDSNPRIKLHHFKLLFAEPIPIPVTVTTKNENWVTTIAICNTTKNSIPLKNIEFTFNFATNMPTNIWGQPWVGWRLVSQTGTQVLLRGGTPWSPDLTPDPNCTNPLTIQFTSSPTNPLPVEPFEFKSEGATPSSFGSIIINLSAAPADNLADPTIKVEGMDFSTEQTVKWENQWQINNLVPGSYTINATPVNNGQSFFIANPATVSVQNNATTTYNLSYQSVPSANVTVTFANAPTEQTTVELSGQNYQFKKLISSGTVLNLPNDVYQVSSNVPGYSAIINPNPIIVPTNKNVTITYSPAVHTPRFVGYFQSWDSDTETTDGTKTNLANLPSYVNFVNLAFMKPDLIYNKGSLDLSNTGLGFNYSGTVLKQAIAYLHQQNPTTRVLVSIGGASYTNWNTLNVKAISDFVMDFGLDGVDVDFEPASTGCALQSDNQMHCTIDTAFQSYVEGLRSVLPHPYLITVTSYGVGAYGQDQWQNELPINQYSGMMLPFLRSPAAKDIDMVNVMAYDSGLNFNAQTALAAYSFYYSNPISMGVSVPPESWGGHVYTLCELNQLLQSVKNNATQKNTPPAMMLWTLQKIPTGTPSQTNPNAQMMATTICNSLGLQNCNQKLLINNLSLQQSITSLKCK